MNSIPRIEDKTSAFYRRILVLRYEKQFKEEEQDRELYNKLEKEFNGIFIWMLAGLKSLEKRGSFIVDEEMKKEINTMKKENNNVMNFVEEKCRVFDNYTPVIG